MDGQANQIGTATSEQWGGGTSTGGWLPNGQYQFPKPSPCPCCGYCPHCGRSNTPYDPNYTQPWYNPKFSYTVTCNANSR